MAVGVGRVAAAAQQRAQTNGLFRRRHHAGDERSLFRRRRFRRQWCALDCQLVVIVVVAIVAGQALDDDGAAAHGRHIACDDGNWTGRGVAREPPGRSGRKPVLQGDQAHRRGARSTSRRRHEGDAGRPTHGRCAEDRGPGCRAGFRVGIGSARSERRGWSSIGG